MRTPTSQPRRSLQKIVWVDRSISLPSCTPASSRVSVSRTTVNREHCYCRAEVNRLVLDTLAVGIPQLRRLHELPLHFRNGACFGAAAPVLLKNLVTFKQCPKQKLKKKSSENLRSQQLKQIQLLQEPSVRLSATPTVEPVIALNTTQSSLVVPHIF